MIGEKLPFKMFQNLSISSEVHCWPALMRISFSISLEESWSFFVGEEMMLGMLVSFSFGSTSLPFLVEKARLLNESKILCVGVSSRFSLGVNSWIEKEKEEGVPWRRPNGYEGCVFFGRKLACFEFCTERKDLERGPLTFERVEIEAQLSLKKMETIFLAVSFRFFQDLSKRRCVVGVLWGEKKKKREVWESRIFLFSFSEPPLSPNPEKKRDHFYMGTIWEYLLKSVWQNFTFFTP